MAKRFNDYYDHENQIQYKPQIWECPKCSHKVEALWAADVSHPCPSNGKKATFYKRVDEEKKTVRRKKVQKESIDKAI